MSAFANALQRRLQKEQGNVTFRRTISVEDADCEFAVKIVDLRMTGSSHGLIDPNNKNAPTTSVAPTARITPPMKLEKAVEFANGEFQRSIEHEQFTPLPVGTDFLS
jgi:hypothetical protein